MRKLFYFLSKSKNQSKSNIFLHFVLTECMKIKHELLQDKKSTNNGLICTDTVTSTLTDTNTITPHGTSHQNQRYQTTTLVHISLFLLSPYSMLNLSLMSKSFFYFKLTHQNIAAC